MKMSLIQPPSWTFLLMLVSCLFLWDNVASIPTSATVHGSSVPTSASIDERSIPTSATVHGTSVPTSASIDGSFQVSLTDLFELTFNFSQNIIDLSSEIYSDYIEQYGEGRRLVERPFSKCPTSFLPTLSRRKAIQSQPEVLLKRTLHILWAWINPLEYVLTEMHGIKKAPEVRDIMESITVLQKTIKMILNKVHPGVEDNENYIFWSGPVTYLQASDEDAHIFAFYELFRCLQRDSYNIDAYLRMAKCRVFNDDNC